MSHVVPVLFVGGCADGRREFHPLESVYRGHRMAYCPPVDFYQAPHMDFRTRIYHDEYCHVETFGDTYIMSPRGMARSELTRRLVSGYTSESRH